MTRNEQSRAEWSVIVGNIGTVYTGYSNTKASSLYREYREQSRRGYGRAAWGSVALMRDGVPYRS